MKTNSGNSLNPLKKSSSILILLIYLIFLKVITCSCLNFLGNFWPIDLISISKLVIAGFQYNLDLFLNEQCPLCLSPGTFDAKKSFLHMRSTFPKVVIFFCAPNEKQKNHHRPTFFLLFQLLSLERNPQQLIFFFNFLFNFQRQMHIHIVNNYYNFVFLVILFKISSNDTLLWQCKYLTKLF